VIFGPQVIFASECGGSGYGLSDGLGHRLVSEGLVAIAAGANWRWADSYSGSTAFERADSITFAP
jgi:hypothetical protein